MCKVKDSIENKIDDTDYDLEAKQMREDEEEKFDRDMESACVPDYSITE